MTRPAPIAFKNMASYTSNPEARAVKLFRNGANQAVRIPRELELPGNDATIRRVGDTLVIAPIEPKLIRGSAASLIAVLATMPPIDEAFPDVDEGLVPLDDIEL